MWERQDLISTSGQISCLIILAKRKLIPRHVFFYKEQSCTRKYNQDTRPDNQDTN